MADYKTPGIYINNVVFMRHKKPMLKFTLTIVIPNPWEVEQPFTITYHNCLASVYGKHITDENPHGWRWHGSTSYIGRGEYVHNLKMSSSLQFAVLGLLRKHGYLDKAEGWSREYLDTRFRAVEDEIEGIILK